MGDDRTHEARISMDKSGFVCHLCGGRYMGGLREFPIVIPVKRSEPFVHDTGVIVNPSEGGSRTATEDTGNQSAPDLEER